MTINREAVRIILAKATHFVVYGFAAIGFTFVVVFFAIRFHWTDVSGKVDERSAKFERQAKQAQVLGMSTATPTDLKKNGSLLDITHTMQDLSKQQQVKQGNLCALKVLKALSPSDAKRIWDAELLNVSDALIFKMLTAAKDALASGSDFDTDVARCTAGPIITDEATFLGPWDGSKQSSAFAWANDAEWDALAQATVKDTDVINRAAQIAGVEPRLIVSSLVVEQMRLFHSQRELFKKFFEPLKILGNSTIISLGVMGIKPTTAEAIEQHLKDPSSPYYLGSVHEHDLDYPSGVDIEKERFNRLTDDKNRSYLYLYGALYLKQMLHQWEAAGHDIQYRPEIVGTLFNVGFPQSHPNDHPQVGGSVIAVGDHDYSFGSLSYEFYYSGQLLDAFPYAVK
jgi:hypothetical protein